MTDCTCDVGFDHAIGCPDQAESVDRCYNDCTRRTYRIYERFCPTHGIAARDEWPDRGTRWSDRYQTGAFR